MLQCYDRTPIFDFNVKLTFYFSCPISSSPLHSKQQQITVANDFSFLAHVPHYCSVCLYPVLHAHITHWLLGCDIASRRHLSCAPNCADTFFKFVFIFASNLNFALPFSLVPSATNSFPVYGYQQFLLIFIVAEQKQKKFLVVKQKSFRES